MAAVAIEKIKPFTHPRVDTGLQMLRNLAHDMLFVAQPNQLRARRRRPNRFIAFFAMITVLHHVRL